MLFNIVRRVDEDDIIVYYYTHTNTNTNLVLYNADLYAFVHRMQMASFYTRDVVSKSQLDSAMVFQRGPNKYPLG